MHGVQVFHCVHFECPAERSAHPTADHDHKPSTDTAMDVVPAADAVPANQQQPHVRLQGLRRANSSGDDASGVDHGDGYGISLLLGGARSQDDTPPPSDT